MAVPGKGTGSLTSAAALVGPDGCMNHGREDGVMMPPLPDSSCSDNLTSG